MLSPSISQHRSECALIVCIFLYLSYLFFFFFNVLVILLSLIFFSALLDSELRWRNVDAFGHFRILIFWNYKLDLLSTFVSKFCVLKR